jgi:acyl dehydratase
MSESGPGTTRITDEAVARLERRMGIPSRWLDRPRNTVVSSDSIRDFAIGQGDDNPLYVDPDYGTATRWSSQIAPPLFVTSAGVRDDYTYTGDEKEAISGGDPLRGIGQYLSSESWQLLAPVRPGLRMFRSRHLHAVEIRTSFFGGGRVAVLTYRFEFRDAERRLYAINDRTYHHAEREKSADKGKYREVELAAYTDDEMATIEDAYDNEYRRGADRLTVDNVEVGDELPSIVKGPLTTTDVIFYHVGIGMGGSDGPLRLARTTRLRVPGWYTRNSRNIPDVVQRCHWEDEYAQKIGQPSAYDYGAMRTNWMAHLITNWMGDDAWIRELSSRVRRFNYIGDTHWMRGRVTELGTVDGAPSARIEIEGVNQRDETTCTGTAVVLLSDRAGTPPAIAEPSPGVAGTRCACYGSRAFIAE